MKHAEPMQSIGQSGMLKATLAMMVLITMLLGLRFYLMLYFPGTPETLALFKLLSPHWAFFGCITFALKSPLLLVTHWIQAHYPALLPKGFPTMPAAALAAHFSHQSVALSKIHYPGQVDWLCLLAIPFWSLFLLLMHYGSGFIKTNWNLSQFAEESSHIISRLKSQSEAPQPTVKSQSIILKSTATRTEAAKQAAKEDKKGDPRTSERLAQSKILSNQPNLVVKPATMRDWEQYKQEESDLMVRDMVRQLQQENSSLAQQQKQLRSTFSQYFSPQALHYLEQNKGSFLKVDNERHLISVLFCDIRGFSTYSLSATSEEVVAYLSEYFEIASHYILQKHNGIVSKLMGDGLMAYWGFPTPNADHAYTATQAALDILHEVDLRNKTKPGATPLNIGIAIATGEAIVGNIGSEDFKDFTLIGPSVNLAARLEEANKSLGTRLLISSETHNQLGGRITCRDAGKIEIRGWQQPEQVFAPELRPLL